MSIFTVTIGTNSYEVYGGLTAAQAYLGLPGGQEVAIGDGADAWVGLTATQQAQMLVAASRYIDRQGWQGAATFVNGGATIPPGVATTLQWPRNNVVDANSNAVDPTTVPVNIVTAAFELCALFADDPDVQAAVDSGSNIKVAKAGSASIENFAPLSARTGTATILPQVVNQLVGQYLSASVLTMPQLSFGTCGRSEFECHRDEFLRSWPF